MASLTLLIAAVSKPEWLLTNYLYHCRCKMALVVVSVSGEDADWTPRRQSPTRHSASRAWNYARTLRHHRWRVWCRSDSTRRSKVCRCSDKLSSLCFCHFVIYIIYLFSSNQFIYHFNSLHFRSFFLFIVTANYCLLHITLDVRLFVRCVYAIYNK